jgi:hypothetical protein
MSRKKRKRYKPLPKTKTATKPKQKTKNKPKVITKVNRKPINEKILKLVCNADIVDFESIQFDNLPLPQVRGNWGKNIDNLGHKRNYKRKSTNPTYHLFYDRGSDILAVAHLDTYGEDYIHFQRIEDRIYSASLDDRLGAYLILSYLSHLPYDILLTVGEESGNSTAQYFETDKQYNWVFEFDRAGIDAVLYQFEDMDTSDILESFGWVIGMGSFSDISYLSHLGCKAFNLGTGYHNAHSPYSYMVIHETQKSCGRFEKLFKAYSDVRLPHDESMEYTRYSWRGHSYAWGNNYDDYYGNWKPLSSKTSDTNTIDAESTEILDSELCEYCEDSACTDCPLLIPQWVTCHGCDQPTHVDDILQDYCKACWQEYIGVDEDDFSAYKDK